METQGNQSLFFEATVIEKYKFLDGNTGISEFFLLIQRFEEYRWDSNIHL